MFAFRYRGAAIGAIAAWCLALAVGCERDRPRPTPATTRAADDREEQGDQTQAPPAGTQRQMARHDRDALTMRRALTRGDTRSLAAAARRISSDRWIPLARLDWAEPLAEVRRAAARAAESPDAKTAGAALAALGVSCASCHRVAGGPRPGSALAAPAGEEEPAMIAHQAAIDELWAGLITPDEAAWQRGAAALSSATFGASIAPQAQPLAEQARDLARRAAQVSGAERAPVLGQLLATCSGCHERHGVAPAGEPE